MTDMKTREAAAIAAALLIARLAQLRFEHDPDVPILPLANCLYARNAKLLLVPSITCGRNEVNAISNAMTTLKADALIVHAAGRHVTDIHFKVGLFGHELFWSAPLHLWLGASASAHFVPDDARATAVALLPVGLRGCEVPPWNDEPDRSAGLLLGKRELNRVLEGR